MSKQVQNLTTAHSHNLSSNRSQTSTLSDSCFSSLNKQATEDDQYMIVVSKRKSRYQENSDSSEEDDRHSAQLHKDLRIIQYDLILAKGLMKELNSVEILKRNCYFGRYGQIEQIIIAPSGIFQVFATYKSQLDAAWAIAALKDLKHHQNQTVRIHYGTSRYCSRFIQGLQCKISGCYFNHSLRENHLHMNQLNKSIQSQYQKVYKLIDKNLYYFVEKEYQQFKNKLHLHSEVLCKCSNKSSNITFPTCKDVMRKLIDKGVIDQQKYQSIKLKIKVNNAMKQKQNTETECKENKFKSSYQEELLQQQVKEKKSMSSIQFRKKQSKLQLYSAQTQQYISSPSKLTSQHFVEEKLKQVKPFRTEKFSSLITNPTCNQKGFTPQISEYLIRKIMNKKWQYCSRFSFVSCTDKKIQQNEETKVRHILSKLIDL